MSFNTFLLHKFWEDGQNSVYLLPFADYGAKILHVLYLRIWTVARQKYEKQT